jgi:hypothetical protein
MLFCRFDVQKKATGAAWLNHIIISPMNRISNHTGIAPRSGLLPLWSQAFSGSVESSYSIGRVVGTGVEMAKMQKKRFEVPDETMAPPKSKVETVRIGDSVLSRMTFEPGWRWSNDTKPVVGTDSCQRHHFGYCLSGKLGTRMDDGTVLEFGPGDIVDIPPGHDGWVIGTEPVVFLEFACATCTS